MEERTPAGRGPAAGGAPGAACVCSGALRAPATPLSHARGSEAPWAQARDGPGPHAGARAAPAATSTKVPPQTCRGPRAVAVNTGRVRSQGRRGRNGEPPATPRGSRTASPAVSLPTARRRCGHRVTGSQGHRVFNDSRHSLRRTWGAVLARSPTTGRASAPIFFYIVKLKKLTTSNTYLF